MNASTFFRHTLLALTLAGLASGPHAQALQDWLPSSVQVAPVLLASPAVQAARAHQDAQLQRARGVEAGSSEWALRLNQQQRRVRDPQRLAPHLERAFTARSDVTIAREIAGIAIHIGPVAVAVGERPDDVTVGARRHHRQARQGHTI